MMDFNLIVKKNTCTHIQTDYLYILKEMPMHYQYRRLTIPIPTIQ